MAPLLRDRAAIRSRPNVISNDDSRGLRHPGTTKDWARLRGFPCATTIRSGQEHPTRASGSRCYVVALMMAHELLFITSRDAHGSHTPFHVLHSALDSSEPWLWTECIPVRVKSGREACKILLFPAAILKRRASAEQSYSDRIAECLNSNINRVTVVPTLWSKMVTVTPPSRRRTGPDGAESCEGRVFRPN